MSIANLFSPNNYDLFARSLELDSDVQKVTQYVDIYDANNTSQVVANNLPLYYIIKNGIAYVWMDTSATYTFNFTTICTQLRFTDISTGYINFPCPDTPGDNLAVTIQATSNNFEGHFTTGYLQFDCSVGPSEGEGTIRFFFNPVPTIAFVSGANYNWDVTPGSNVISQNFGFLGWCVSYPVKGLN